MAGAQIRRFLILPKELDADEGELTRTRKLRREVVERRYAELIDAMYGAEDNHRMSIEFELQDGRRGKTMADVRIAEIQ